MKYRRVTDKGIESSIDLNDSQLLYKLSVLYFAASQISNVKMCSRIVNNNCIIITLYPKINEYVNSVDILANIRRFVPQVGGAISQENISLIKKIGPEPSISSKVLNGARSLNAKDYIVDL